ncbi:MAG: SH3 domain-containing protein [Bacteroidales bacterium]|nr:SH3 domain-containing protein [Clostridium sp.]MCM1204426.1 SH3 domain-containing protein [Bacteroidales bacterium]
MIKNTEMRKRKWKVVCIILWFAVIFMLPAAGIRAEAAATCKTGMAYPANTSTQVNFRKKAGTIYTTYGLLDKNQAVTILGCVRNNGIKWYKCRALIGGKKRVGYISAAYVIKKKNPLGIVNKKVGAYLNVRKQAKTSAAVIMQIPKDTRMTVKAIKKAGGKYWYKVKVTYNNQTKTGFVQGSYVTVKRKSVSEGSGENTTQTGYVNSNVTTFLNIREYASTTSAVLLRVPRNTKVVILGTEGDWYRVQVTYDGKTVTGYAAKEYITLDVTPGTGGGSEPEDNNPGNVTDKAFETLLKNFPESYKASLRALHSKYPNWKFVAVDTNLDWGAVIENEGVVGRNVIQSNYPKGTNSLAPFSYLSTESGAYNWANDTYIVKDGANWYSASKEVISHYMDPRNFLNENDIFQFEALAYDASQSESVVQSILSNTFMKGKYNVTDSATGQKVSGTYKKAFMDAGKGAQANPYFLATRVKQEVGVNGSNSTSGTYPGYEGIYNFYNIGAFDGGDAVAKGLQWAKGGASGVTTYDRPWTTPYKSIVGGAKYIATNYINKGQNTLYFQKFNVKPKDSANLYMHQYMTNVQAPYSEGRTTRSAYSAMGILGDAMVFYIPVYKNMPSAACGLPAAAGNPNPYLLSVKLYNGSTALKGLTPTFRYDRHDYTLVVPKSVSQVTVQASPVSTRATASGTGTYTLKAAGKVTTIKVVGRAENGATQTYTFKITRDTK